MNKLRPGISFVLLAALATGCMDMLVPTVTTYYTAPDVLQKPQISSEAAQKELQACVNQTSLDDQHKREWVSYFNNYSYDMAGLSAQECGGFFSVTWHFKSNGKTNAIFLNMDSNWRKYPCTSDRAVHFAKVVEAVRYWTSPTYRASVVQEFTARAEAWRALSQKPPIPEQARKYDVLAQNALQSKEFAKAANYYERGLQLYETWPAAQFNVALIYAELGNYDKAVFHMKQYLILEPYAKDARAYRDQMYIWEEKSKGQ